MVDKPSVHFFALFESLAFLVSRFDSRLTGFLPEIVLGGVSRASDRPLLLLFLLVLNSLPEFISTSHKRTVLHICKDQSEEKETSSLDRIYLDISCPSDLDISIHGSIGFLSCTALERDAIYVCSDTHKHDTWAKRTARSEPVYVPPESISRAVQFITFSHKK